MIRHMLSLVCRICGSAWRRMRRYSAPTERPPAMDPVDLSILRGAAWRHAVERVDELGAPMPWPPGTTARMQVRRYPGGPVLLEPECAIEGHSIHLSAGADATGAADELSGALYDVLVLPGGVAADAVRLFAGRITAADAVTTLIN